ncbi:MAG: hypothetical protein F6K00_30015 [Leptolyngbya sp. SIOISBB]|nr:hypothetical protein [Leptolyngbya sp. SIOISBB]
MTYSSDHPDRDYAELTGFSIDADTSSTADPEGKVTPKPRWPSNPIVQLLSVAVVVGTGTFGLYSLVAGFGSKPDTAVLPDKETSADVTTDYTGSPDGALKTDLAFGDQSDDLAALADMPAENAATNQPKKTPEKPAISSPPPAPQATTPVRYTAARPVPQPAVARSAPLAPTPAVTPAPAAASANVQPDAAPPENNAEPLASPSPALSPAEPFMVTVISGTTAPAILEQPAIANASLSLKTRVRLTQPLTTASGAIALPAGTLLIADVVSQDGNTAWLEAIAIVIDDAEHPLASGAVLGMPITGPWQRERPAEQADGINFEQILLTGAIASLDLDRDDFLGGVALDILGQLNEQQTAELQTQLEAEGAWILPSDTELVVHINETLELPELESAASKTETPVLSAPSDRATLLASLGPEPATTQTIELTPGHPETFRLSAPDEPIVQAWLSEPAINLTFDQPLFSGNARVIRAIAPKDTTAAEVMLDVITAEDDGQKRWHRIVFRPASKP